MGTLTKIEDPDEMPHQVAFHQGLQVLLMSKQSIGSVIYHNLENPVCDPLKYIIDNSMLIALICLGKSIRIQRVKVTVL